MSERAYGRLLDKCEKLEADNARLQGLYDSATDQAVRYAAEIERLQSLLFRARNYIAGEKTADRPKDAILEIIDAALEPKP